MLVLSPILMKTGYGLDWRFGVVIVWGGLRGAVGLALGLIAQRNSEIDEGVIHDSDSGEHLEDSTQNEVSE